MKRTRILLPTLAALVLLAGCMGNSGTQRPTGPSAEEQIQKIQNDPSMPPQAKAAAISQIRARQGGAAGGASR